MPELAQAADGLHPPKDLFDELSFPLADVIARMSRGPALGRPPPSLLDEALLRKSKLALSAPTRRFVTDRSRTTLVDQARSFD